MGKEGWCLEHIHGVGTLRRAMSHPLAVFAVQVRTLTPARASTTRAQRVFSVICRRGQGYRGVFVDLGTSVELMSGLVTELAE